MSYEAIMKKVSDALFKRDFFSAQELIRKNPLIKKDPHLYKAHYIWVTNINSPEYDIKKGMQILENMIDTFSDPWSSIELAKVLITNFSDGESVSKAEDLLTQFREKDLTAKYYLAEILANGLNSDSNGPIFDKDEALALYGEIFEMSGGKLKQLSAEKYCRLASSLDEVSNDRVFKMYAMCKYLQDEESPIANELLGRVLIKQIHSTAKKTIKLRANEDNDRQIMHHIAEIERFFNKKKG